MSMGQRVPIRNQTKDLYNKDYTIKFCNKPDFLTGT